MGSFPHRQYYTCVAYSESRVYYTPMDLRTVPESCHLKSVFRFVSCKSLFINIRKCLPYVTHFYLHQKVAGKTRKQKRIYSDSAGMFLHRYQGCIAKPCVVHIVIHCLP